MAKIRPGKDNTLYLDLTLPRGPQGFTGFDGKDAKINGVNALNIEAGTNISIDQEGDTLTINSTGGGGGGTSDYTQLTNKPSINNITLSGNKTSSDLGLQPAGNYVTNTDYATSSVGGVLKVSNGDYGLTVDSGVLKGTVRTYAQYNYMSSKGLVAKGTLENVITGKNLEVTSNKVTTISSSSTNTQYPGAKLFYDTTTDLQTENERLKATLPTTTGEGQDITLDKTAEFEFIKPPLPMGNSEQNGEPRPDNEVFITNVTGNVEVTISNKNNTESKTLPVSLGNIELCKIGNYQDYLYKNNGKWYKYNAINKLVLNGSENWSVHGSIASWFFWDGVTDGFTNNTIIGYALSNYFTQKAYNTVTSLNNGEFAYGQVAGETRKRFVIKDTDYTTVANFKSWLSTHNTIVYYVLATPTSTEITDATLISQLEEISKTLSYQGQTNITSNTITMFDVEAYQSTKLILENLDSRLTLVEG